MKQINITKEQLDKLLSMNNPIIVYKAYIEAGDKIVCDDTNEVYLVSDSEQLEVIKYTMFSYIKINVDCIDLFDWEANKDRAFPDYVRFTTISKLEKIIQSKDINLNKSKIN